MRTSPLLYLIVVIDIINPNDTVRQSKVCWHIIGFGSTLVEALLVPRALAVLRTASKRVAAVDAYCKLLTAPSTLEWLLRMSDTESEAQSQYNITDEDI